MSPTSPDSEQLPPQEETEEPSRSRMPDSIMLQLRPDLIITERDQGARGKVIVVKDPGNGEQFEIDEQTIFLFQACDGIATADEIIARFNSYFDKSITTEDISQLFQHAQKIGLLQAVSGPGRSYSRAGQRGGAGEEDLEQNDELDPSDDDSGRADKYRWTLLNPSKLFAYLNRITKPVRWIFLFMVYGLFVGIPLALITFFDNQYLMSQDLARLGVSRSYFGHIIFSLFVINFLRCVVQGVVCTYYGGTVSKAGIKLRFGLIPRFFVDKSAIKKFDRNAKLWAYGSNMLFRLVLVVLGVFAWYFFRGTGSQLSVFAIIVTHAALISFLLVCLPLRASDGYKWLVTFFRLPLSLIKLAVQTFVATFTRKPLPTSISDKDRRRLFIYSLVLVSFWTFAFFRITSHITTGLVTSFPNIFGEVTKALIGAIVVLLVLKWGFHTFSKMGAGAEPERGYSFALDNESAPQQAPEEDARQLWQSRAIKAAVVVGICGVLALPYPYRPGGEISLLPPEQQLIQAPISGKVSDVSYNGGDGQIIPAGTVVATMVSTDLENLILILKEQISEQEAELQKRRSLLENLLDGPRSEEVEQARAHAAEALEESILAERQLQTVKVTSAYSDKELQQTRLLPEGLIAQLDIARVEKQAEVDRLHISEQESNLEAKRRRVDRARAELALLLSGASKGDIEAARQDVAGAEAELRRLNQELRYARSQARSTGLQMSFDGFLVDSYLRQKLGTFLNRGDTYATAQAHRNPMVELILPEYDVAEIQVGSPAEIKLMAYPNQSMQGQVVSIEPAGGEGLVGQVFRVVILLSEVDSLLKTGMSGQGKIEVGNKPLFVLLTRPIVRFVQIEMWSWIP